MQFIWKKTQYNLKTLKAKTTVLHNFVNELFFFGINDLPKHNSGRQTVFLQNAM